MANSRTRKSREGYSPSPEMRRRLAAASRKARLQKRADPFLMNQERDNPDVSKYERSEEALEHSKPDMRTEWLKEERFPNNMPAPVKANRLTAAQSRKVMAKTGNCLRIAKALFSSYLSMLPVAAQRDLLACQASDFMGLPTGLVANTLERLERLAAFRRRALESQMDLEEAPEMEEVDELPEGLPSDEELLVCMPVSETGLNVEIETEEEEAAELEMEEAVGAPPEMEASASFSSSMDEKKVEEIAEEIAKKLSARAKARIQARRRQEAAAKAKAAAGEQTRKDHYLMDVGTPAGDYHSDEADYYFEDSNSADAEEQLLLSNPVLAQRRQADGETSVSDPGGLNPWDSETDYHDPENHSYEEKPMSEKAEEQMLLADPVLASSFEDEVINSFFRDAAIKDKVPEEMLTPVAPRRAAVSRTASKPARKAGIRSVRGLDRSAGKTAKSEIDELSSLWPSKPRVDHLFNK